MATAPKVQTLAEAMAELNPAYAQSQKVIQKRQAGLGAKYDAQRAGITAERGEGFNVINNQATARGGSFSGVPVEEQSRYLSTKYLPGLQQADYQQNEEDLTLQGELAGINKEIRVGAIGRIDQQKSALNSWNMQQQQLEAQRREAEANRAFQAQQNALDRQQKSALAAASARSTQAAQPSQNAQIRAYLDAYVDPKTGKVPVAVWQNAVRRAHEGGMGFAGASGFANTFWNYADDKNWKAYKNGYDRWK